MTLGESWDSPSKTHHSTPSVLGLRPSNTTQSLIEERKNGDENQGCYYDVINNHKTGVASYTNYHEVSMRRPADAYIMRNPLCDAIR